MSLTVFFPTGTITYSLTSVDLFLDLLRVGLYGCGTLRSNCKGFPKDLKPLYKVRQQTTKATDLPQTVGLHKYCLTHHLGKCI